MAPKRIAKATMKSLAVLDRHTRKSSQKESFQIEIVSGRRRARDDNDRRAADEIIEDDDVDQQLNRLDTDSASRISKTSVRRKHYYHCEVQGCNARVERMLKHYQ